jgi:hypothetical protein
LKNKFYLLSIFIITIYILGCGEVSTTDNGSIYRPVTSTPTPVYTPTVEPLLANDNNGTDNNKGIRIIGKITYDRVHVNNNGIGLNYNNITQESMKQVKVELVKGDCGVAMSSNIIASTTTDDDGNYEFNNLPSNQNARICVYAQMEKFGDNGWRLKVVDNTNGDALYTMQSSSFLIGESSTRRNLNASSGWDGDGYSGTRTAAPFAILDSLYQAMKKVISADNKVSFPPLKVNWSIHNVPSGNGDESELRMGQIITSHYNGDGNLYILGDANSDTDEYDDHVMIHEWGHYFEANFSRADSIGGSHGDGDRLDIRVAFGEGWGNAWSAIATDNPIYFDTQGFRQSQGFSMNIESDTSGSHGWFSEDSIQRILYDLYDSHDDGADTLSLGFKPIYDVLVNFQKNTPAFTSIFTFITGLQKENKAVSDKIDAILNSENINHIYDIYGSKQANLYSDMGDSGMTTVCTSSEWGKGNKLYNHKYIRFSINENRDYTISVKQNSGGGSDPDFGVYRTVPFEHLGDAENTINGIENSRYSLTIGEYLLDVSDYNGLNHVCFDITVNYYQ